MLGPEGALESSYSQFCIVPMKKRDEERKRTVILNGYVSVITWCLISPASLGSSQSLQLPHSPPLSFLGTDAITILELLYWPCCRKLPLSQAALRSGFCDPSPELLAFRTSGKRHRRGFRFILTSTSRISLGNISGTTIIFIHTQHTLKYRNPNAHKFTYSFKEGRRKVAIQRLSFASARWWASLKELLVPLMTVRRGDWSWSCLAPEPSASAEVTKQFGK